MDLKIKDKTALVTGSTAGIGLAIAAGLAGEGASVIINGRTDERVKDAIAKIRESHPAARLEGSTADCGSSEGCAQLIREFPDVDILVNNVGMYEPKDFAKITDGDWLRIFEINVLSGVRLSRHYLPRMLKKNEGRVVFISSESGVNPPPEMIHYGMTKTAQLAISRGLAEMTIGTGVTVNSVLPGPTWSEGVERFVDDLAKSKGITPKAMEKEFFKTARPTSLLQRFATTEEVATMVVYICGALSSATNGAALRVEGGVVRSIV